ncbi:MAG: hypothetical protein ACE5JP_13445, partial [Candidatus Bipolaricaulia bacterium]
MESSIRTRSPNIYATHVAFLEIACQGCGRSFKVTVHCRKGIEEHERKKMDLADPEVKLPSEGDVGWFHYGDPPRHTSSDPNSGKIDCIGGDTMGSVPIKVLEFWIKEDLKWIRKPQYEVDVRPDWWKQSREI